MELMPVRDSLDVVWRVRCSDVESSTDGAPIFLTVWAVTDAGVSVVVDIHESPSWAAFDGWVLDLAHIVNGVAKTSREQALAVRGSSVNALLVGVDQLISGTRYASKVGSTNHGLRWVLRRAFDRAGDHLLIGKIETARRFVRAWDGLRGDTVAGAAAGFRILPMTLREICHQELNTLASCECAGFCFCEFSRGPNNVAGDLGRRAPVWNIDDLLPVAFDSVTDPAALVASVLDSGWQDWSWWQDMEIGTASGDLDAVVVNVIGDDPMNGEEFDDDPARPGVRGDLTGRDILRALGLWWRGRESHLDAAGVDLFRRSHLFGGNDLDLDCSDGDAVIQTAVYGSIIFG